MSGKLLCLDLSGNIGWAIFDLAKPEGKRVRFGTLPWKGLGYAEIGGRFFDWLHDFYALERWDAMAWEEPWLKPGDTVDKMKILIGLPIIACAFARSERQGKMPFASVPPKELKKRMTGRQDADKRDVVKACWDLGWKVANDNEGDACGVGLVCYRRIWPIARAA